MVPFIVIARAVLEPDAAKSSSAQSLDGADAEPGADIRVEGGLSAGVNAPALGEV
jgi:hypothetical protein